MIRVWRAAGPTIRWLVVLGVALVAVFAGSGPARARTLSAPTVSPCTVPDPASCGTAPASSSTSTDPGSSTTAAPAATFPSTGPYGGQFIPCPSASVSRACTAAPAQVGVTYPTGQLPPTVDLSWVPSTAPNAPQPGSPKVTLDPKDAVACQGAKPAAGHDEVCWSWPDGLKDKSWILNGTYRITPNGQKPIAVGLAVPPAPPRQVVALATADQVKVSWQPSPAPEPDLVGYSLTRNGQPVYFCTIDGLGPGSHTPCASPLAVTDHPGAGKWTYAISALRLGVDDASGDAVASGPATAAPGPVSVAAPAGPARPVVGLAPPPPPAGAYDPYVNAATPSTAAALPGEGAAPETAPVQNLKYPGPDSPVVGSPSDLALKTGEPGPRPDVVPAAVLALAVIALAIAAHFVYLRVQLGLAEARMAERRRRAGTA